MESISLGISVACISVLLSGNSAEAIVASTAQQPPSATVPFIPRSCYDAKSYGHPDVKESGMYWIDPDGPGIGDPPIYAYCNMTNGETSIYHDAENQMNIPVCAGAGCYSRNINYLNATVRQMIALTEISEKCYQSIEVNCLRSLFLTGGGSGGKPASWWLYRNNMDKEQYFWHGDGKSGSTCKCGLDKPAPDMPNTCINSALNCNCDADVAIPLTDSGMITAKTLLPVTTLKFGNVKYEGGSYKLGKLKCTGVDRTIAGFGRKPQSCHDLWRIGYNLNGIYLFDLDDIAQVEFRVSFCDFKDVDRKNNQFASEKIIGTVVGV